MYSHTPGTQRQLRQGVKEEEDEEAERSSEPGTRLSRALAPYSPVRLPSVIRRGAGLGPERPGAQANSFERAAGGVSLPTPPGAGHFLYGRGADAGFAPALRTIVRNPHPALGLGPAVEGGRRDPPFLLQPPAPAPGGPTRAGMLPPRPPLPRRQRRLPAPGQAKGNVILERVPAAGREGGRCAV